MKKGKREKNLAEGIEFSTHPIRQLAISTLEKLEDIANAHWVGTSWLNREDFLVKTLLNIARFGFTDEVKLHVDISDGVKVTEEVIKKKEERR